MDKNLITKNRRKFLKNGGLSVLSLALGINHTFANKTSSTFSSLALDRMANFSLPDKDPEMRVLNDRPINAETSAHLLDEPLTSGNRFFVRNNGIPPEKLSIDTSTWILRIEGESVIKSKTFTLSELKSRFKNYTYQLTLECGGNGRKEFNPPAKGNQWSIGAVGCAAWTGVRLKDVFEDVGIKSNAVYYL